jgi:hypothetical protein
LFECALATRPIAARSPLSLRLAARLLALGLAAVLAVPSVPL